MFELSTTSRLPPWLDRRRDTRVCFKRPLWIHGLCNCQLEITFREYYDAFTAQRCSFVWTTSEYIRVILWDALDYSIAIYSKRQSFLRNAQSIQRGRYIWSVETPHRGSRHHCISDWFRIIPFVTGVLSIGLPGICNSKIAWRRRLKRWWAC